MMRSRPAPSRVLAAKALPVLALALGAAFFAPPAAEALPFRPAGANDGVAASAAAAAAAAAVASSPLSDRVSSSRTTTVSTRGNETTTTRTTRRRYRVLQVQIVHRHGDRTPITPLVNETYWSEQLPRPEVLERIAEGTTLVRDEDGEGGGKGGSIHSAGGRGPFGQLTNLGLMQMVELGSRLREELHLDEAETDGDAEILRGLDADGHHRVRGGRLFGAHDPLRPSRVRVTSTDFPRTVQSARALLVGLFPDGVDPDDPNDLIEIDVRHTARLIPDPQPRRTAEQSALERKLANRPHLAEREEEMRDLAVRTTRALRDVLGRGHEDVSFGVGEDGTTKEEGEGRVDDEDGRARATGGDVVVRPLPWVQLAEITKCLEVRDLLPPSLSREDTAKIASHAAWRWFETLRHPRLARLAMHDMASDVVDTLHRGLRRGRDALTRRRRAGSGEDERVVEHVEPHEHEEEPEPALHIYSAHDSTLIGLLCAFRLEQPETWPEYGSYIKVELIEAETVEDDETVVPTRAAAAVETGDEDDEEEDVGSASPSGERPVRHFVRFSLNGEVLRCYWGVDERGRWEPTELMPLEHLTAMVRRERHDDDPFFGGGSLSMDDGQ